MFFFFKFVFFRPNEGVEWCKEALVKAQKQEPNLVSRCLLYIGIGYHIQAQQTYVRVEKKKLSEQSLHYFNE